MAPIHLSSICPARPTNGRPVSSSFWPGPSPMNISLAAGSPSPNTVWVRPSCSGHFVQPTTSFWSRACSSSMRRGSSGGGSEKPASTDSGSAASGAIGLPKRSVLGWFGVAALGFEVAGLCAAGRFGGSLGARGDAGAAARLGSSVRSFTPATADMPHACSARSASRNRAAAVAWGSIPALSRDIESRLKAGAGFEKTGKLLAWTGVNLAGFLTRQPLCISRTICP